MQHSQQRKHRKQLQQQDIPQQQHLTTQATILSRIKLPTTIIAITGHLFSLLVSLQSKEVTRVHILAVICLHAVVPAGKSVLNIVDRVGSIADDVAAVERFGDAASKVVFHHLPHAATQAARHFDIDGGHVGGFFDSTTRGGFDDCTLD